MLKVHQLVVVTAQNETQQKRKTFSSTLIKRGNM